MVAITRSTCALSCAVTASRAYRRSRLAQQGRHVGHGPYVRSVPSHFARCCRGGMPGGHAQGAGRRRHGPPIRAQRRPEGLGFTAQTTGAAARASAVPACGCAFRCRTAPSAGYGPHPRYTTSIRGPGRPGAQQPADDGAGRIAAANEAAMALLSVLIVFPVFKATNCVTPIEVYCRRSRTPGVRWPFGSTGPQAMPPRCCPAAAA